MPCWRSVLMHGMAEALGGSRNVRNPRKSSPLSLLRMSFFAGAQKAFVASPTTRSPCRRLPSQDCNGMYGTSPIMEHVKQKVACKHFIWQDLKG